MAFVLWAFGIRNWSFFSHYGLGISHSLHGSLFFKPRRCYLLGFFSKSRKLRGESLLVAGGAFGVELVP